MSQKQKTVSLIFRDGARGQAVATGNNGCRISLMKRIALIAVLVFSASIVLAASVLEGCHYYRMHHFVKYGLHIDVVLGNSDIGRKDTYYARIWNLSVHSIYVEGCRLPGGYAGEGVLYRWDVQRWNVSAQRWDSLRGADNWVPTPFGGYANDEKCLPQMTRIRPLGTRVLGWVYKDWVTTGEPVRMAIHTSVSRPATQQTILFTSTFVIDKNQALPPLEDY